MPGKISEKHKVNANNSPNGRLRALNNDDEFIMLLQQLFYFVRHGETNHNKKRLSGGAKTNVPLNNVGKFQARALKEKINALDINTVICSPLQRAIQTARLATKH